MTLLCLVVQVGEASTTDALTVALRDVGLKTFVAVNYAVARDIISQLTFDLVFVVGTESPKRMASMVRELSDLALPTIVMKASGHEEDDFLIYEAGAFDVLSLDSSVNVAALKGVRAATTASKQERQAKTRLVVGPLALDPSAMTASVDGAVLALSPKQFDLLFLLASRAGKLVQRRLMELIFGYPAGGSGRALDMQVLRLRKSLRAAGSDDLDIAAVYGYGYCLHVPAETKGSTPQAHPSGVSTALV